MAKKRRKVDARGRNVGEVEPFLLLRRSLVHSAQYAALSTPSRALMLELQAMYNGTNNGTVFLSVRDAAARLGFADLKAAMRAFNELADLGWITETIGASFHVRADAVSRARAWRLNWIHPKSGKCIGPDALPALNFSQLTTTQKRRVRDRQMVLDLFLKKYRKGNFAVEESSTLSARMAFAEQNSVEESSTLESLNGGKPPIGSVEESATHITTHRGLGAQPDSAPSSFEIAAGPRIAGAAHG